MENQDNKNKWSWDDKRRQYKKDLEQTYLDNWKNLQPFKIIAKCLRIY